jgi:hypothetical protein
MIPHTPAQWALTLITIAFAIYGFASALDALAAGIRGGW